MTESTAPNTSGSHKIHIEHEASGGEKTAATFLWVVVGLGLAYGVAETALKVAALLGGG